MAESQFDADEALQIVDMFVQCLKKVNPVRPIAFNAALILLRGLYAETVDTMEDTEFSRELKDELVRGFQSLLEQVLEEHSGERKLQ